MHTLGDMIKENAQRYADKTAFIFEDRSYTFKQVNDRINSLVNSLAESGLPKGDRVGLLAYNSPKYFEVLGLAKAGRVCVPLR
jgi:acyl-CoA synthetase (AMP-forming)/AMP-acid ligase II